MRKLEKKESKSIVPSLEYQIQGQEDPQRERRVSRRDFVKKAAAATTALASMSFCYQSLMKDDDVIKLVDRTSRHIRRYLPKKDLPNIFLLSIDTLRADFFNPDLMPKSFGYFEKNGQIFTNAYSNSTWTLPSHATMLSGRMPNEHGVELENSAIDAELPMIQEQLQSAGYYTMAITDGGYIGKDFGFARGFHCFIQPSRDRKTKFNSINDLGEMLKENLNFPVFLFFHTYKIHDYIYGCSKSPRAMESKYKKQVVKFDDVLADILLRLQHFASSGKRKTYLIFTSDHGEGFGEGSKDNVGHAGKPFPEQVKIPLVLCGKGNGYFEHLTEIKRIPDTLTMLAGRETGETIYLPQRRLVAEYLSQEGLRTVAEIGKEGLKFREVLDEPPADADIIDFEENPDLEEELKTLGYLG